MVANASVTDVIKSLNDLRERFGLRQTEDDRFFSEWTETFLSPGEEAQAGIDRLKQRYDYHRIDGLLLEGTINLVTGRSPSYSFK